MNYNQNSWLKLWKGLKRIKMQKLTISRDELICHKKYFYENVVENLNQRSLAQIGVCSEQELYKFIIGKISTKEKILEEPLNKFKRDLVKEIFGEEILKMIEE